MLGTSRWSVPCVSLELLELYDGTSGGSVPGMSLEMLGLHAGDQQMVCAWRVT